MKRDKYTLFLKNGEKMIVYAFSETEAAYIYPKLVDFVAKGDYMNSNKYIYLPDKETWVSNLFYNH